ncbi:hypothetical protein U1Q18_051456 [Sarracenia purpurea var. burkii]
MLDKQATLQRPPSRLRWAKAEVPYTLVETPSRRVHAPAMALKVVVIEKAKAVSGEQANAPLSELRVSHKMAERKRRKEMKELFDDLRGSCLRIVGPRRASGRSSAKVSFILERPSTHCLTSSSPSAVEHITHLAAERNELLRENDQLRMKLDRSHHSSNSHTAPSLGKSRHKAHQPSSPHSERARPTEASMRSTYSPDMQNDHQQSLAQASGYVAQHPRDDASGNAQHSSSTDRMSALYSLQRS